MSINVKDTHLVDTQVSSLLGKLLNGDVKQLSEQDKFLLTKNRQAIIQHLEVIFSKEISRLLEGKECLDATTLFWGLKLAEFFEASETFEWVEKLCHLSIEDLDNSLGSDFVTEDLPYLLAGTMNQWGMLKVIIENPGLDEFIRSACLDALVFSVVKNRIDRSEITSYFKSLFLRILDGELDDELLCTHLVSSCSDFWPGECLEEIREAFGLNLVDEFCIGIDCVLEAFLQGKDYCIEALQKHLQRHNSWEAPSKKIPDLSKEGQPQKFDRLFQSMDQVETKVDRTLKRLNKEPRRNDICECGSGRKYKKCCMNKPFQEVSSEVIVEEAIISHAPIESEAMKALPEDVKESIASLYFLTEENPEEVIQKAPEYIEKYPDIPMLYNFLYGAYRQMGYSHEAIKLLKETLKLFPDYLFARLEYALYLLRRGEPEKAHAVLENAGTLSQLYPERKIFHTSEWVAFAYVMSLYWIQKGDLNQANIYLSIIRKITPDSYQIEELQRKMRSKLFFQYMEEKEPEPQMSK